MHDGDHPQSVDTAIHSWCPSLRTWELGIRRPPPPLWPVGRTWFDGGLGLTFDLPRPLFLGRASQTGTGVPQRLEEGEEPRTRTYSAIYLNKPAVSAEDRQAPGRWRTGHHCARWARHLEVRSTTVQPRREERAAAMRQEKIMDPANWDKHNHMTSSQSSAILACSPRTSVISPTTPEKSTR